MWHRRRVLAYAVTIVIAAFILFPLVWMFFTSFKTPAEIQQFPPSFFPARLFNGDNYREVLDRTPFLLFILNSLFISLWSCLMSIFISSLAGYGFAKFKFPGKEILFFAILSFLIVPFQSVVVPLYRWVTSFGLVDTYAGVALPLLASAFGVFLMRQAVQGIPKDFIDAARIDGCREFRIYLSVVMPMVKPALATLAIIKFMWSWNEFFWPLVITNSTNKKVVTLGLQTFTNIYFTEYHLVTAATVLSVLPMALAFAVFQRGIIRAVTMSGLKG
jgi:ABC-type glycerol-3-phosphate transport system permease component